VVDTPWNAEENARTVVWKRKGSTMNRDRAQTTRSVSPLELKVK